MMNIVLKILGFLLLALAATGLSVILNEPGSVEHYIIKDFNISTYQYSYLYSAFTISGLFSIVVGVITDKYIGLKMLVCLSMIFMNSGCVLYSLATWNNVFWLMIVGRFVSGIGDTSMIIALQSLALLYFKNENNLSVASSVIMSFPWLGSSLVFFVSNRLEQYARRYYNPSQTLSITATSINIPAAVLTSVFIIIIYILYSKYIANDEVSKHNEPDNKHAVKGVLEMSPLLWIIILISTFSFVSICNLIMMSQEMFMKLYSLNVTASSNLSSFLSTCICISSPLVGSIVDSYGRNLTFVTIGTCMTTLLHGLMAFTTINPYCIAVLFSISYATTVCAVWPMLHYLSPKESTSTACGAFESSVCFLTTLGSVVAGTIADKYNYVTLELFYFILTMIVLPFWIIVWKMDFARGSILNMSSKQRKYVNM